MQSAHTHVWVLPHTNTQRTHSTHTTTHPLTPPRIIYFKLQNCLWPNRFSYALAPLHLWPLFLANYLFFQLGNNNTNTAVVYGRLCDFIYGPLWFYNLCFFLRHF